MEVHGNMKCIQECIHGRYPNIATSSIVKQLGIFFPIKNLCVFVGCFSQPSCKYHYQVPAKGPLPVGP